jgi:hypothetical protein
MPNPRPVPGRVPLLGHTVPLLRDPLEFFTSLPAHGDVVKIRLGPLPVHVITTPELAWQVLATDADKFDKAWSSTRCARSSATAWPPRTASSTAASAGW